MKIYSKFSSLLLLFLLGVSNGWAEGTFPKVDGGDEESSVKTPNGATRHLVYDSIRPNEIVVSLDTTTATEIIIPDSISWNNGGTFFKVVGIGDTAFKNTKIKSITLGKLVKSIGADAFKGCESLGEVKTDSATWVGLVFGNEYSNPLSQKGGKLLLSDKGNADADVCFNLPASIIGKSYLFEGCQNITQVKTNGSEIGVSAFKNCTTLNTFTITGNKETTIGNYAFYGCTALSNFVFPNNQNDSIGQYAFAKCSALTKLKSGTLNLKKIGEWAFSEAGITAIDLPNITRIRRGTFYKSSSLASVKCKKVTQFDSRSFEECSNLASVEWGEDLKYIYDSAFLSTNLKNIVIPKSVKGFGKSAFYGCKFDTVVCLCVFGGTSGGGCDITFGDNIFKNGQSKMLIVPNVRVRDTLKKGFGECFEGIYSFYNAPLGYVKTSEEESNRECKIAYSSGYNSLKELSIWDYVVDKYSDNKEYKVVGIESKAFNGASGLSSITYWGKDTNILNLGTDSVVFPAGKKMALIVSYKVARDTIKKDSIWKTYFLEDSIMGVRDTCLYYNILSSNSSGNGECEVASPIKKAGDLYSIVIPKSVKCGEKDFDVVRIAEGAIKDYLFLNSVDTKESYLKHISANAFSGCEALKDFQFPATIDSIEENAFRNTGLRSVVLPNSVRVLEDSCFAECDSLKVVKMKGSVSEIGKDAFWGEEASFDTVCFADIYSICATQFKTPASNPIYYSKNIFIGEETSPLLRVAIPNNSNLTSIGSYAFINGANLKEVTISPNIKTIGEGAFQGCVALNLLTIPNGVEKIGDRSFESCGGLGAVSLPESVSEIGSGAFEGCNTLKNMVIPSKVKNIEKATFANCTQLETITLPKAVKTIGDSAFANCSWLNELVLPKSMSSIGKAMCLGCVSLSSIDVPDTIKFIPDSCFMGCRGLRNITLPTTLDTIGTRAFYNAGVEKCESYALVAPGLGGNVFGVSDRYEVNRYLFLLDNEADSIKDDYEKKGWREYFDWSNLGLTKNSLINYEVYDEDAVIIKKGEGLAYESRGDLEIKDSVEVEGKVYAVRGIDERAFEGTKIASISFNNYIEMVGEDAFKNCDSLKKVQTPSIASWCKITFNNSDANPVKASGSLMIEGSRRELTDLEIPEGVGTIQRDAFYGLSSIQRLIFDESVTDISDSAFYGCDNLKEVYCFATENIPELSIDGGIFDVASSKKATLYLPSNSVEKYKEKGWGNYFNLENTEKITDGMVRNKVQVSSVDGRVVVKGLEKGTRVSVFDTKGNLEYSRVATSEEVDLSIKLGLHCIKVGNEEAYKIFVR